MGFSEWYFIVHEPDPDFIRNTDRQMSKLTQLCVLEWQEPTSGNTKGTLFQGW